MDYKKLVYDMLIHLGENFNREEMTLFLSAMGSGVAKSFSLIDNHEHMHKVLDEYLNVIAACACSEHVELQSLLGKEVAGCDNETEEEVDYTTFLRDIFKPEKTND